MVLKVVWFGNNAYSLVITIQNTFELPVEAMKPDHFMLNHPKNPIIFVGDLVLNCRYGQVAFWQFLSIIMLLGFEFWSKGIFWISSWKGANINLDSQLLKWILEVGYVMSFIHKVFVFSALFFGFAAPRSKASVSLPWTCCSISLVGIPRINPACLSVNEVLLVPW